MANPGTLHDWVEDLPARGRYTFSRAEALSATDASPAAVKQTLYRLKKRKAIVSPRRDFFVVLPPEYRTVGCPPAAWFIDQLMKHLGRRYYVALLTAGQNDPTGADRSALRGPRCEAPIPPATRRHSAAVPPPVVA